MIFLLQNDHLKINEIDVFRAVVSWGRVDLPRQKATMRIEDKVQYMEEVMEWVRFAIMSKDDIVSIVEPTGV
jgi:hypothetical protein